MLAVPRIARLSSLRTLTQLPNTHDVLYARGDVTELSQLKNGFRVATYNNNRPTATIGVWIDAGSRYETSENNGVAALFENLVHTGSTKRSAVQLRTELAKMGAQLKSFTTREHSAYFVECLSSDVEKVVDVLADVMCNTKIDAAKVEEQRAIALNKLNNFESNHRGVCFDNLHMTAFQGTPLGMSPLGTTDTLNKLSVETVSEFVDDIYKPNRMVLTAVGGVDHEGMHKLAERYFSGLDNNYKRKVPTHVPSPNQAGYENIRTRGVRFTGSELLYRDDSFDAQYCAIAVEGIPRGHLDYLAMQVASTFVGKWDRTQAATLNAPSTLAQHMNIGSEMLEFENFNISYDNTGLWGVYFVLKGDDFVECETAPAEILRVWKHLAVGVTEEEVDRAKNALKANLFLALESNSQIAGHVAAEVCVIAQLEAKIFQVLSTGKITPLHTLERKIHYIDANAVREAASRHIYDRDPAVTALGKVETWTGYHQVRYGMSWWRV